MLVSVRKVNSFFLSDYKSHLKFAQIQTKKLDVVSVCGKCISFSSVVSCAIVATPFSDNEEGIRQHTFMTSTWRLTGTHITCEYSYIGGVEHYFKMTFLQTFYLIMSKSQYTPCLLYTSPSPRDRQKSRMPSSA